MNEVLTKLENTVRTFTLDISLDSIDKPDEKRILNDKNELVSIHATYKIYCTQIYRITIRNIQFIKNGLK
jgi:hypothetical protein